jgi:nucleoside-diphosphate-sugar epimerase
MERDTGVRPLLSEIYRLAKAALTLGTVRLRAVDHAYDWTFTSDLAEAVRLLVEAESVPHRNYNLSNGVQRRLSDVLGILSDLVPCARFELVGPGEPSDLDLGDDPYTRGPLSIERLRQDVGFVPAYDLERGLGAALPWWAEMVQHERLAQAARSN